MRRKTGNQMRNFWNSTKLRTYPSFIPVLYYLHLAIKHSTALTHCLAITVLSYRVSSCRQAVRYIPRFCLCLPRCNAVLVSCLLNWTSFQRKCKEFKVFTAVNTACKSLSCGLWHYVAWRRLNYEKDNNNVLCRTILIRVKKYCGARIMKRNVLVWNMS